MNYTEFDQISLYRSLILIDYYRRRIMAGGMPLIYFEVIETPIGLAHNLTM